MRIYHTPLYLAIVLLQLSCNDSNKEFPDQDSESINYSETYKPPDFQSLERTEKILKALTEVRSLFEDCAGQNHIPGIAYGIVVDDTLVAPGGIGSINLSTKLPVTDQSLFRIASMTKSFTALAILKLRDEGKLMLHHSASKYVPELTDLVYLTEDARPVTIFNLLTMTAGFPEDNPWGDRYLDMTDESFMSLLAQGISFSSVPSQQYEYSNLGYGILGNIITRVSGMPFQEFITEKILEPLGMQNTYWEYANVPENLLALGYRWEDDQWKEEPMLHDGAFGAMGGLITSIEDFSKYVSFHLSAWPPRNGSETGPVSRSSVREMQRLNNPRIFNDSSRFENLTIPAIRGYGYGLAVMKDSEGIVEIGHNGGLPGFGSSYVFFPEHGIGIMAFGNRTYCGGNVKQAIYDVAQILMDNDLFEPREILVSDILAKRKDQVVELIKNWNPVLEKEILAKNFYMDRSREDRIGDATKALSSIGEIVSIDRMNPENQLRGSFQIHGKKGNVEVIITLTPESTPRLQWLSFHYK